MGVLFETRNEELRGGGGKELVLPQHLVLHTKDQRGQYNTHTHT